MLRVIMFEDYSLDPLHQVDQIRILQHCFPTLEALDLRPGEGHALPENEVVRLPHVRQQLSGALHPLRKLPVE